MIEIAADRFIGIEVGSERSADAVEIHQRLAKQVNLWGNPQASTGTSLHHEHHHRAHLQVGDATILGGADDIFDGIDEEPAINWHISRFADFHGCLSGLHPVALGDSGEQMD